MLDSVEPKKSVLAKAATILVTVFLVSLGLCGLNFLALAGGVGLLGNTVDGLISIAARLELLGMAGSAVGLFLVGILAIVKGFIDHFSTKESGSVSIIEKDEDK